MRQVEHFSAEAKRILKGNFDNANERICSLFEKNCAGEIGVETTIYWRNSVLPRSRDIFEAIDWLQNALFLYDANLPDDVNFSADDWSFFSETVRECAADMQLNELTAVLNLFLERGVI